MTGMERTRQQLDPVGSLGSRPLSVILSVGAFVYAVVMVVRGHEQLTNVFLGVLALLWLAAACATVIVATAAKRAPFTRASHVVVHLLVLGSITLSVAGQWGANRSLQDDSGPIALGILLLAIGPYRPGAELASMGSLSALFVGFLTLLQVPMLDSTTPTVVFVLVGMTPILALGYASAAYSGELVRSLERWQRGALRAVDERNRELMDGITRVVQQDRFTILGRDVLPFFNDLLERGTVTDEDRTRAREISGSMRALMVAEADRSWLEVLLGAHGPDAVGPAGIVDRAGCAAAMGTDQRVALRALIVALADEQGFVPGSLRVELGESGSRCWGRLQATVNSSDFAVRSSLSPYFATLRVVFADVQVAFQRPVLALKFFYEQR